MPVNPATTARKLIAMPHELVQRIEDYRFAQRIKTEAEAIRVLIERGLQAESPAPGESGPIVRGRRSVGPEDEARGGHEAPEPQPGPTVPGLRPKKPRR